MKKEDIISGIEELLAKEAVKTFGKEFGKLTKEFDAIQREEEKAQRQREEDESQEDEVPELSEEEKANNALNKELDDKIKTLIGDFRVKQSEERKQEEDEWKQNLSLKKELIEKLDQLNAEEERIGPAINKFRAIQEEWKTIGNVASDKYHDVQNRYSRAVEQFNYNIGIYKELKSNDLSRNQKIKEELVLEVKALLSQDKIKEIEKSLRIIQEKWAETGPTEQEAWEVLKSEYWDNVKAVQGKIQEFYNQRKSEFNANLKLKIELIEKVQGVMAGNEASTHQEWETVTKEMLEIQEEWNKVGAAKREDNEQARALFRSFFDTFFGEKDVFYSELKAKNKTLKEKKVALIEKAKSLENSTDWKQTADDLIRLQRQWKDVGTVSRGDEQKLWKTFRASCNVFFDAKQAHFEKLDEANAENLVLKQEVIAKIAAYAIEEDVEKSIEQLKSFSSEFNAIGHVPFKEKEAIYNDYKKALESHYNKLELEESEKEKLMFENRLEILKQSVDPAKAFEKEKIHIRNKISTLNDEIVQFENNLGFFSGKGAEKLKEQVAQNVNKVQAEIGSLKIRLRLIPDNYSKE